MTATPATPRSTNYGPTAILGATALLIAVIASLALASKAVHEAEAAEQANRVLAGNISVVGTAKVRQWTGSGFELKVPARWHLVADGKQQCKDDACARRGLVVHRWEGLPEGAPAPAENGEGRDCLPAAICVELRVRPAAKSDRQVPPGSSEDIRRVYDQAFRQQVTDSEQRDTARPRYVDYGGVTAKGGAWVGRSQTRLGDRDQASYFFATCKPGTATSEPVVDRYWELRMTALADAVPTFEFHDVLGSLVTQLPRPAQQRECADVVTR